MTGLDLNIIKKEMNLRITDISVEESQKITKELQPEIRYTNSIIHDLERGEYIID